MEHKFYLGKGTYRVEGGNDFMDFTDDRTGVYVGAIDWERNTAFVCDNKDWDLNSKDGLRLQARRIVPILTFIQIVKSFGIEIYNG